MFRYWEPWPENRNTTDGDDGDAAEPVEAAPWSRRPQSIRAASAVSLATTIRRCRNAFLPTWHVKATSASLNSGFSRRCAASLAADLLRVPSRSWPTAG